MGVEYGKDVLGNDDMWGQTDTYGPGWPKFMIFVMALMLIAPAAAMAIIIIVAMAVGDSITRCWIPWCCGVFCGAVTAFFFWQTVNALLVASNAAFVCIAIDKENGVGEVSTSAEGGALYALVQGEIAEEVKALKEGLADTPIAETRIPVISNVDVEPHADADAVRETLAKQLTSPVQWEKTMQTLLEGGLETSTEVGPGKVISGIMKRIDKKAVCENFTV